LLLDNLSAKVYKLTHHRFSGPTSSKKESKMPHSKNVVRSFVLALLGRRLPDWFAEPVSAGKVGPMRRSFLLFSSLALLTFLFPSRAGSCQMPCYSCYPAPLGTTHIVGISPQVGIAGITYVYVNGYCFGDSQGSGTVTVNGEAMTTITNWSDAEIIFELPFDAQSGDLKVISSSYGSDDSASESQYTNRGNNNINANFTVVTPNGPPLCCVPGTILPFVSGSPSVPQYVTGTWNFNNGPYDVETLTLTQGPQNADGTWQVTGSYVGSPGPCGSGTFKFLDLNSNGKGGILDQYGDLVLKDECDGYQRIWRILDSGDVTSQGLGAIVCPAVPSNEYQFFLQEMTNFAEGPYFFCAVPPLFKSSTDIPTLEIPSPQGWAIQPFSGSQYPTYGAWQRSLPLLNGFVGYAGRFVFEQSGPPTSATDTCYAPLSPTARNTGVTGGGWFVSQNDVWGNDDIGMKSQGVTWYQKNVTLPCQYTSQQNMYIDTIGGPSASPYTTNQLTFQIQATKIYSEVQPQGGSVVKECENYPSLKGSCKP
jgi:hypothetical protein